MVRLSYLHNPGPMAESPKITSEKTNSADTRAISPSERYQKEIQDFKLSQCEKAKECVRQEARTELDSLKAKIT